MPVVAELRESLMAASKVEPSLALPADASFFQQRLGEVIISRLEAQLDGWGSFNSATLAQETYERLSPVIDFLTRVRSIDEFQVLKRQLVQVIWDYHPYLKAERGERYFNHEEERVGEVVGWLGWALLGMGVFPDQEWESLLMCGQSPKSLWSAYEYDGGVNWDTGSGLGRVVDLQTAARIAEEIRRRGEVRSGFTIGKWRLGPHGGHIDLLEGAKVVLGRGGVLFCGVESQRAIQARMERSQGKGGQENDFCLPDQERLERMAAIRAVDYVVLFDPPESELVDPRGFYHQADQALKRDFWFVGTQNYHWLSTFWPTAQELGTILLWHSPKARMSNTALIKKIVAASKGGE
ncbi:hypothetical protein ACFLZP_01690 [Patescibacteria group bacterium]